jgi:hypothetical protein
MKRSRAKAPSIRGALSTGASSRICSNLRKGRREEENT